MTIKAIITDIEGTMTDIAFVHRILFPFSRKVMPQFINQNRTHPLVELELNRIRRHINQPNASLETVINQLIAWIDTDQKIPALKQLQGFIWKSGFENGEYTGHIYPDAHENFTQWIKSGIKLYIYSSGSAQAQQLLCKYSDFGDIRAMFSGYFDTEVGPKQSPESYQTILNQLELPGEEVLFLSDVVAELDAAKACDINTILINRDNTAHEPHSHTTCQDFNQINLAALDTQAQSS